MVLVLTNAIIIIIIIITIDFIEIIDVEYIIVIMAGIEIKVLVKTIPKLGIISVMNIMVQFEEIIMHLINSNIKVIMARINFDKLVLAFRLIDGIMVVMEILVVVMVLRGKVRVVDWIINCWGTTV